MLDVHFTSFPHQVRDCILCKSLANPPSVELCRLSGIGALYSSFAAEILTYPPKQHEDSRQAELIPGLAVGAD